ncbi:MAG: hypothetical protein WCI03_03685 [bacterium]
MIFKSTKTLAPGRSLIATLDTKHDRPLIECRGGADVNELDAAVPALMQNLADKARLPVRWKGAVYYPVAQSDHHQPEEET